MKDLESKSLSKQIKRYAQVGGVVGKLATKLATQKYLGVKIDKKKHAEEIRAALGGIKGPLMKVAQLSATIPDLLPSEYVEELRLVICQKKNGCRIIFKMARKF